MTQVRILGLDPGLESSGWYVLQGDLTTGLIEPPAHFGVWKTKRWADKAKTVRISDRDRTDYLSKEFMSVISLHQITHVALEDFVYMGGRGATSEQMVALVENFRIRCEILDIHCEIYTNGFWKTILMQCHTANKNQVSHFITRQKALHLNGDYLEQIDPGNHIRDAIAIAYCRFKFLRGEISHAKYGNRQNDHGAAPPAQGRVASGNAVPSRQVRRPR